MAHSIVQFRAKSEVVNDFDLLLLIGVATYLIENSTGFSSLRKLAKEWRSALPCYGPGTVDLKLEELIQTPRQLGELAALLEAVLTEISKYGEILPDDVLKTYVSVPGVRFHNYKAVLLSEPITRLQHLLQPL